MFCGKCGNRLSGEVLFCPKCGAKVAREYGETAVSDASAPVAPSTEKTAVPQVKKQSKLLYVAGRSVFAYKKRLVTVPLFIVGLAFAVLGFIVGGFVFNLLAIAASALAAACLITIVITFAEASKAKIMFYNDKIVVKSGIFTSHESLSVMTPLVGVSVYQSFGGKIFGYGNLLIDKVGRGWDINTYYIKKPYQVKRFLESLISDTDYSRMGMYMSN